MTTTAEDTTAVAEATEDADEAAEAGDEVADELTQQFNEGKIPVDDDAQSQVSGQTGKSFKSIKTSIANSMRRFSITSKQTSLRWNSQYSLNSNTTNDYLDPVERKRRKAIGKVVVREEYTEFIKENAIEDVVGTGHLLENLMFFEESHQEFPDQPVQNMMDIILIETKLMRRYLREMDDRLDRLGRSPTPTPVPTPTPPPSPNFVQKFFCYHKYVPSDEEEEEPEEESRRKQRAKSAQDSLFSSIG